MPRTPKPANAMKRSFEITRANEEHIQKRAEERATFADALNLELDYLRTFNLPGTYLRRIEYAAKQRGARTKDEVTLLVLHAALLLPAARQVSYPPPEVNETRRSSTNFLAANDQLVVRTSVLEGLDFSGALNRELDFGRTYGLTADLFARFKQEAERRNATVRDLVTEILVTRAIALPDPPVAPTVDEDAPTRRPVREER